MQDLIAFATGIDPFIAVAAPTVTWVLTNAVSFFRLKDRLSPLRLTEQEPILVRMADGPDKQETMRELYDSLDAARELASSVLRKDRQAQLVRALQIALALAAVLFTAKLFVDTVTSYFVAIRVLCALVGILYMLRSQARLRSLAKEYLFSSADGFAEIRELIESASTVARQAIAQSKKQIRSLGPTELEFKFLRQFLATADALKHTESILLVETLEAGQRSINATYRDQIAKVIGLRLDQLLRETIIESPDITSKEFAKMAFEQLKELGYTNLVVFRERDIENLVGPEIIQSFKDEKHPKLISKNMKRFLPLRT